jgi:hypothetical protein
MAIQPHGHTFPGMDTWGNTDPDSLRARALELVRWSPVDPDAVREAEVLLRLADVAERTPTARAH